MEKQMIKSVKAFNEQNEKFALNYYLLSEKHVYGVYLEKVSEEGIVVETEAVSGVGCSRKQTMQVIQMLAENAVTPVTLCEVLDDLHDSAIEEAVATICEIA